MFVVCTALSALTHQGSKTNFSSTHVDYNTVSSSNTQHTRIYEVKVEPAESLFTQQVTDQSEG